jgi:uncharacterized protein
MASQAATPPSSTGLRTVDEWRAKQYPGSQIMVEKAVTDTDVFTQYVTSYYSDGLRISALLTVPKGNPPTNGWPVLVWNHGGADPKKFGRQNDNDIGMNFASKGYVTFQPAYRGYAESDGDAFDFSGLGFDTMNAIASIKKYPGVNSSRIGVGGHSLGGALTLFDVLMSKDVKVAVTVAGLFVPLRESIEQQMQYASTSNMTAAEREQWKPIEDLIRAHGSPSVNPTFWARYDLMAHLSDISAPMQIHAGLKDDAVPWEQSQRLYNSLRQLNKPVELHTYANGDHQLTGYTTELFGKIVSFLDRHLKQ